MVSNSVLEFFDILALLLVADVMGLRLALHVQGKDAMRCDDVRPEPSQGTIGAEPHYRVVDKGFLRWPLAPSKASVGRSVVWTRDLTWISDAAADEGSACEMGWMAGRC